MEAWLAALGLCAWGAARADDTSPVLTPAGRVQLDFNRAVGAATPEEGTGFGLRRARVQMTLQPHDLFAAELDWNLDGMIVQDLYVDVGPSRAQLRAGQTKEPLSSTFMESSLHLPFAERPMLHEALASDRLVGAVLRMVPGPVFVQLAAGARDPFSRDSGGTEGVGRVAWEVADGVEVSAGGATGAYYGLDATTATVTGHPWVDASSTRLIGMVHRGTTGVRVVSAPVRVDLEVLGSFAPDAGQSITGNYIDVLVMLTGEAHQPTGRLEPDHPVLRGGPGAWEIGARYEHIRARGAVVADVDAVTGGLTWYPHEHVKLPANVVHTWLPGEDELAVVVRLQIEA